MDSNLWLSSVVRPSGRYILTAQALHWITATLMFILLPVAWVMMNMPETAPRRSALFTLHKSIGLTIVMIVACLVTESLSGLAANAQTTTPIKVQTVAP